MNATINPYFSSSFCLQTILPCYGGRNSIMTFSWKLALLVTHSRRYSFKRMHRLSLSKRDGLFLKGSISMVITAWCHFPMPTHSCQIAVLAQTYLSLLWYWPCCCLWCSAMRMFENLLAGTATNPDVSGIYTEHALSRIHWWADRRFLCFCHETSKQCRFRCAPVGTILQFFVWWWIRYHFFLPSIIVVFLVYYCE